MLVSLGVEAGAEVVLEEVARSHVEVSGHLEDVTEVLLGCRTHSDRDLSLRNLLKNILENVLHIVKRETVAHDLPEEDFRHVAE